MRLLALMICGLLLNFFAVQPVAAAEIITVTTGNDALFFDASREVTDSGNDPSNDCIEETESSEETEESEQTEESELDSISEIELVCAALNTSKCPVFKMPFYFGITFKFAVEPLYNPVAGSSLIKPAVLPFCGNIRVLRL